ncbi:MAG: hypothetical protein OK452_06455 [Thaumarchaeota archaeon]|nr:hypothetical protein [Nitrososphaerota archaeon]
MPCDPSVHNKRSSKGEAELVSPAAWIAIGNLANAKILVGMSGVMALRIQAAKNQEATYPESEDTLIESLGGQTREGWSEKVKESFHVHIETFKPAQFLEGVRSFFEAVGLRDSIEISIDEQSLHIPGSPGPMDLQSAVNLGSQYLQKKGESVRTIEVSASGRNEVFLLLLNFYYSRKHLPMDAPIELEVNAMSNELGPRNGELFSAYKARMKAFDSDVQNRARIFDASTLRESLTRRKLTQNDPFSEGLKYPKSKNPSHDPLVRRTAFKGQGRPRQGRQEVGSPPPRAP